MTLTASVAKKEFSSSLHRKNSEYSSNQLPREVKSAQYRTIENEIGQRKGAATVQVQGWMQAIAFGGLVYFETISGFDLATLFFLYICIVEKKLRVLPD